MSISIPSSLASEWSSSTLSTVAQTSLFSRPTRLSGSFGDELIETVKTNAGCFTLSRAFQGGKPLRSLLGTRLSFNTLLLLRYPADGANKRLRVVWRPSLRSRWRRIKYSAATHAEVNAAATACECRACRGRARRRRKAQATNPKETAGRQKSLDFSVCSRLV